MKFMTKNTIKQKMSKRLETLSSNVVLRRDFADMGNQGQISRGLTQLIKEAKIIRIGHGVYAKARISTYTGKIVIDAGTSIVFREALDRLKVKWDWNWAEKEYASRQSTQIPAKTMVRLKSRFRGRLYFNDFDLLFEDGINTR